jgi:hypothetical protein
MLHFDYQWDLHPDRIILDNELNIDRLGWKHGDLFQVVNVNGKAILRKLDPLEQFVKGHKVNFGDDGNGCS